MRISTSQFHHQGVSSIQKHQNDILETQVQLSTGKRVNASSDDPVAMNQIHGINRSMATLDQYAMNGEYAKTQLVLEETAIEDTVNSLQRARELSIKMLNGTYNDADKLATAQEVDQLTEQVRNIMNMNSAEGENLFAGNVVLADRAFIEDPSYPGYYTYIGSESASALPEFEPQALYGARHVQIAFDDDNNHSPDDLGDSSRIRITDNGARVFSVDANVNANNIDNTTGVDNNILNVLVSFSKLLKGEAGVEPIAVENGNPANAAPTLDDIADQLKDSINSLTLVRAEIGGRQNRIEAQYDAGEAFKIALEGRRSSLQDTDIVEAITQLTQQQNSLQMAQQVFTRIQDMSLFNYLR